MSYCKACYRPLLTETPRLCLSCADPAHPGAVKVTPEPPAQDLTHWKLRAEMAEASEYDLQRKRDILRAGLQALLKVISDHGDGYVRPEAERAAHKALRDAE